MGRTLSPLRYPGGKSSTYPYIKELINLNECNTYIEPFAGGAGVAIKLLVNEDIDKIIINDYDKSIYSFWYSVLYQTDKFIDKIEKCEITMDEWYRQKSIQEDKENADLLDLGFSTFFLNRTNRSGIINAGVIGGKEQKGKYKLDCRFNKSALINRICLIANKRAKIELYRMDAYDFIDEVILNTNNSFTFFDPPYFEKGPSLYTNFYTKNQHRNLANKILSLLHQKKFIITYDHSQIIKELYADLDYIEYYLNYSANNKTKGIEYMFFSNKLNKGQINNFLQVLNH